MLNLIDFFRFYTQNDSFTEQADKTNPVLQIVTLNSLWGAFQHYPPEMAFL